MPSFARRAAPPLRTLLLSTASALALGLAAPAPAAAQNSLFTRRVDPTAQAMAAAQASSQSALQAATAAQNTAQIFARAAQATAAVQAAQASARALALTVPTGVPNGLGAGGLDPRAEDPSLWIGAAAPTQASVAGRTQVTVAQHQQQAILTWRSFNVGRQTDLVFDQSAGGVNRSQWSVLNRVEDPNAAPSHILGSIRADGQVLLINRNGIIFGGSSQVDVGTLTASALDVGRWGESRAQRNQRFLDGITSDTTGGFAIATFSYEAPSAAAARVAVTVEQGARITAAGNGAIRLFAPQVTNAGTLSARSGQVLITAGFGVHLEQPNLDPNLPDTLFTAPAIGLKAEALRRGPNDPATLDTLQFIARNDGLIAAARGNVTIAGSAVT
ncbi:MAG TPA: filamentous hemagglutinin N-terminal domain-containing protein, partial [Crenalkalicoccus sp.]|nr:filamentous hemagglutinin N-terminal domain-containing protein [Crenalkalicoccus sp.]